MRSSVHHVAFFDLCFLLNRVCFGLSFLLPVQILLPHDHSLLSSHLVFTSDHLHLCLIVSPSCATCSPSALVAVCNFNSAFLSSPRRIGPSCESLPLWSEVLISPRCLTSLPVFHLETIVSTSLPPSLSCIWVLPRISITDITQSCWSRRTYLLLTYLLNCQLPKCHVGK